MRVYWTLFYSLEGSRQTYCHFLEQDSGLQTAEILENCFLGKEHIKAPRAFGISAVNRRGCGTCWSFS